jgi:hypothetical protein
MDGHGVERKKWFGRAVAAEKFGIANFAMLSPMASLPVVQHGRLF